ncbi:hypothetical protein LO50_21495 [Stutzerimonas stutzeri]|uniref:Uncharacterized protein n=1 Tax=Stutzerimonas stutzeri TaxID=316 RepID=A0A0D7E0S9_STUST|nr:hypothetical protein LO50_21495 [Stutzerimonas stutzeri]
MQHTLVIHDGGLQLMCKCKTTQRSSITVIDRRFSINDVDAINQHHENEVYPITMNAFRSW